MSLVHDYIEERKARLVRLGVRPCPGCAELRKELADKLLLLDGLKLEIAELRGQEEYIAPDPVEIAADDLIYRSANGAGPMCTVIGIAVATCRHFNRNFADLTSRRRDMASVLPRQVAMYLAKKMTTRSMVEIARKMGLKDHTTVLHAFRKIEAMVESGHPITKDVEAIRARLGEPRSRSRDKLRKSNAS
jgi:hypothetical protein